MERAVARRPGGARSPTRGSISWGVTVVRAVMKESAAKTAKELVMQSPILHSRLQNVSNNEARSQTQRSLVAGMPYQTVAVNHTNTSTNALRRNISPNGHRNSKPLA